MRQTHFILSIILSLGLLFNSCKKYPKNTLILKSPKVVLARTLENKWRLVYYSVNEIDSTNSSFLAAWRELGLTIDSNVKKGNEFRYECGNILVGYLHFSQHKKEIIFTWGISDYTSTGIYPSPTYPNQRNIFLEKGLNWKILMLTKNEFQINTEFQGNKYEIHFK